MKTIRTPEHIEFCKMVGANLRYARIARGLTQARVGELIAIRFQQIQKYEAGTNGLTAWRLQQLAHSLKVSVLDILNNNYIADSCNKKAASYQLELPLK